jgi:hypothetical protein
MTLYEEPTLSGLVHRSSIRHGRKERTTRMKEQFKKVMRGRVREAVGFLLVSGVFTLLAGVPVASAAQRSVPSVVTGTVTCAGTHTSHAYYYEPDASWFSGCINTDSSLESESGNTLNIPGAVLNIDVPDGTPWVLVGGVCGSNRGGFITSGRGPDYGFVVQESTEIINGSPVASRNYFCEGFWLIGADGSSIKSNMVVSVTINGPHLSCSASEYGGYWLIPSDPTICFSAHQMVVYMPPGDTQIAHINYGTCGSGVMSGSVTVTGGTVRLVNIPRPANCDGYWLAGGSDLRLSEARPVPIAGTVYPPTTTYTYPINIAGVTNAEVASHSNGIVPSAPVPGVTYRAIWPAGCSGTSVATTNASGNVTFTETCNSNVVFTSMLAFIPVSFGPDALDFYKIY